MNDDYRTASSQTWSSVADAWGELISDVDRQLARATDWILESASPRSGETVLELAGGPGTISLAAAGAVGDEGGVICTDFSPEMNEVARRRAAEHGAGRRFTTAARRPGAVGAV